MPRHFRAQKFQVMVDEWGGYAILLHYSSILSRRIGEYYGFTARTHGTQTNFG